MHEEQPVVLVLDFGAQYAQLIARRVREARVFSEIVPHDIRPAEVQDRGPAAMILSGGPMSVYAEGAPRMDPEILELGIPILGFCYGMQLMARELGGEVPRTDVGEYGFAELTVVEPECVLLDGLPDTQQVWMSHRDSVGRAPEGFRVTAATGITPIAAMEHPERALYATQFHPEADASGFETRINIYKHRGYFPPQKAEELIAMCRAADVTVPETILKRFVDRYRATSA